MIDMDEFDVAVIGAGVIGLAVADELSQKYGRILLVEKNPSFGQETSSRNSEVIHAGIYFPPDFLKTEFCVRGNTALYDLCRKRNIPHRPIGKMIIATDDEEVARLNTIKENAEKNGVCNLSWLDKKQIRSREPEIRAQEALLSPSTGIIDSHSLMRSFIANAQANGVTAAFRSECTAIRQRASGYEMTINQGEYRFLTNTVVNAAGLHADKIAQMTGIDIDRSGYRLRYCKGSYFWASPAPRLNHLIYPVPPGNMEFLGVHATLDMGGRVRFGPDIEYVDAVDYGVDEGRKDLFLQSVRKYLPGIAGESLLPDTSGIRPKLHGPGEANKDFIIKDEKENGYPGVINLIGIESPGLTSCVPIAKYISAMVAPYLE
ncbi:MAG: NAD(P)/FAD-dependent oxidoreductase [Deltaproteobacteria bacterium]|nr:NAD(P)/FAD-dependent oxidoreductase [Deltaproteobacteria bacterium]